MEVPHRQHIRLTTVGAKQLLEHIVTGELVRLPTDKVHSLAFDPRGSSYPEFYDAAHEVASHGEALKIRIVYTRTWLTTCVHQAKSGKLCIQLQSGNSIRLDKYADRHSAADCYSLKHDDTKDGFKVWC